MPLSPRVFIRHSALLMAILPILEPQAVLPMPAAPSLVPSQIPMLHCTACHGLLPLHSLVKYYLQCFSKASKS